jgi:hypothetical protein
MGPLPCHPEHTPLRQHSAVPTTVRPWLLQPAKELLVAALDLLHRLCSPAAPESLALEATRLLTRDVLRALLDPTRRLSSPEARRLALLTLRQVRLPGCLPGC